MPGKVHIFREGHKILRNLPLTFDCMYCSQKLGEDFANFCDLLRLYELYRCAPAEPSANKVLVQDNKEPIFATRARLEPTTYLQLFSKLQVNQKIESKTGRTHYNYLVNLHT